MTSTPAAWSGWSADVLRAAWDASRTRVGSPLQITVGVCLAAAYLVALGAQQDQLATAVILAGAGISVAWPATGLAMFALLMPMREPEILVPFRFNAILSGAIAFGCILRLPVDRPALRVHPAAILLVGYVVISGLSILPLVSGIPSAWAPSALNMLLRLATGVALLLSAWYLFRLMSPWPILGIALVGATLAALLALGDILNFLPLEAITRGLVENTGSARASGAFADPNFLGLYAATAMVFALGVLMVAPRPLKVLLIPVVFLLLACVVLTYSRGAYVGVASGVLFLAARWRGRAALVLAASFAVIAVLVYPAFLEARQGAPLLPIDIFDMARGEASRRAMAEAGIAIFSANPVFGVGFGIFQFVSPGYVVGALPDTTFSHNQFISILAEQGLVGVAFVASLIAVAAVMILRSGSILTNAALATGLAFLGASVFLHTASVFQSASLVWLILAVTLATGRSRATQSKGS